MKNTHAKTHSSYTVDIVHIFRVARDGEGERFQKVKEHNWHWISTCFCFYYYFGSLFQLFLIYLEFYCRCLALKQFSNTRNRMLLWHGSRLSNWIGILSQGCSIVFFFVIMKFEYIQCVGN